MTPKSLRVFLLGALAGMALGIRAPAAVESTDLFEHLPVLDNGRVMPMDSYARHTVLSFAGRSRVGEESASRWIARVLFDPESTASNEVFLVNNPEVIEALGLDAHGRGRYSYDRLRPTLHELTKLARAAWDLDNEARSPVERELIRLHSNLALYTQLSRSMAFCAPQPEFAIADGQLRRDLGLEAGDGPVSYLALRRQSERMSGLLEKNRGAPRDRWTSYQQELFRLASAFREWAQDNGSSLPAMIPIPGHAGDLWVGPWEVVNVGAPDDAVQREIDALAEMSAAYRAGQQVRFDMAARTFLASVVKRAPDAKQVANLKLEVRYNRSEAFYRAELLYGFAFLAAMFAMMSRGKWVYAIGIGLTLLALVPHTYGIIARMIIMGRPPVTNLYATFVFVGWVCVLLGLLVEYLQRNRLGLITAAVSGLALLMTSARFAAEGDTMGVMVAVLDSNFWLATHVVCISIGYAGCCVAGLLGHIYLLQALRRTPEDPVLQETASAVYGALGFGMIFSFFGTMLGGVWADQSWGRFWGWDPKENGALVIVLWSAIVFHARLANLIGPRGFAAGCVLGVIGVLAAWLGVNLLGVGLHSYGFTSGLARGFFITCAVEVLFVVLVTPFSRRSTAPAL
jgi:ABC-type transport system involved in cytochrome c biogenesis permease subunit